MFCLTLRTGALRRVALSADARAAPPTVIRLFRHPRAGHLWVSCGDGRTVVLDAARGGRLISRRLLPGVGFQFQADGTAAGVWVSFAETRYIDPLRHQEQIGSPGLARVGPTGGVRQYVPSKFVILPVRGTHPLRVYCADALYELTADNQLHEIRRWLRAELSENFLPAAICSDSAYEWVSHHHYVQLTGPAQQPPSGFFVPPAALTTAATATTVELTAALPEPGQYTLSVGELTDFGTASVELLDRLTDTRYDLHQQPTVTLTAFDATSRRVALAVADAKGEAALTVRSLAAGVYSVRAGGRVQRLVVE